MPRVASSLGCSFAAVALLLLLLLLLASCCSVVVVVVVVVVVDVVSACEGLAGVRERVLRDGLMSAAASTEPRKWLIRLMP